MLVAHGSDAPPSLAAVLAESSDFIGVGRITPRFRDVSANEGGFRSPAEGRRKLDLQILAVSGPASEEIA